MRVVIAGSRTITDLMDIAPILDFYLELWGDAYFNPTFCQGEARGVDVVAREYLQSIGCTVINMRANWELHGKAAGHIRNQEMANWAIEEPGSVLIAILTGESRGTKNMVETALKTGVEQIHVYRIR